MLVTPDGRWVFPNSEEFLTALGDPAPDYDAISFAVKNLGFIKLQIIGQSIIEIELHPRNVELPALLAAQQQLLSRRIKLFRIRFLDTSRTSAPCSRTKTIRCALWPRNGGFPSAISIPASSRWRCATSSSHG